MNVLSKDCIYFIEIPETCLLCRYAILSILHYDDIAQPKHRDRASQYNHWDNELNFSGTTFPFNIGVSFACVSGCERVFAMFLLNLSHFLLSFTAFYVILLVTDIVLSVL